jgi:recombination protein RecT
MSNQNQPQNQQLQEQKPKPLAAVKAMFSRDDVKQKFHEMMGKRSAAFMTSVLQIIASSKYLSEAEPMSIYNAAATAATMDLPLNNNLGYAYIIPYRQKRGNSYVQVAQFQMGYKGFIQLAFRTGLYKRINATDVRDGELKSFNRLTGEYIFEWEQDEAKRQTLPVIGYAAFFELLNGFEKTNYMTIPELRGHGAKYSKTFNDSAGRWNLDFEGMAIKTVLKLLLSKYGPLSIEMQTALKVDQALINDADATDVTYLDSEPDQAEDKETERIRLMIDDCKSVSECIELLRTCPIPDGPLMDLYLQKRAELGG